MVGNTAARASFAEQECEQVPATQPTPHLLPWPTTAAAASIIVTALLAAGLLPAAARTFPPGTTVEVGITDQARMPGRRFRIPHVTSTHRHITTKLLGIRRLAASLHQRRAEHDARGGPRRLVTVEIMAARLLGAGG